ncbi:plasmid mobilization relaxosome protein MobC [Sneathiella sp. P13V-1]|uniref:plasmid mobilization protein n=1 Tax=Sneathiella sp. P13V-1 TaxID=2697366 RepID=UPI00187B8730|nr:plasmid mobilization relaxosome protein MobC [Sneathiella sp. P13V-1]MBE7638246.1 plasmid mobilization relaxosome protein MobC [Sneathiella sp. P13V-1]
MMNSPSKKEHRFEVRMSAGDLRKLDVQATAAGMTRSEFVRLLLANSVVHPRGELHALKVELTRIGVNLNQLARASNRHQERTDAADILHLLAHIESGVQAIVGRYLRGDA